MHIMKLFIGMIKKELQGIHDSSLWKSTLIEYTAKKGFLTRDDVWNVLKRSDTDIFTHEVFLRS